MMGAPGERVNIMQWRAAFQHDIDTNAVDGPKPTDLYPNMHVDVYPDEVLRATDARAVYGRCRGGQPDIASQELAPFWSRWRKASAL